MEELKTRLQKLRDQQSKAHEDYLKAKKELALKQQQSFNLLWQIEQTKEQLMTRQLLVYIIKKKTKKEQGDL